ncbi:hypothetical protein AB4Y43_17145 [Paraburkholderia sp. BR10872]|uniref:hypothetical protein n=1 Tax=Paraburkholderia sp. BR10872 TaxID=3236989 RepID=UPI0034D2EB03
MLLFYVDEPLNDTEVVQVAEAFADVGERPEVEQRRIPFLYPVGEPARAPSSTELLSACLAPAGLKEREVCALAIPREGAWRAEVLADAFYRMTHRRPYLVQRWSRVTSNSPAHRVFPVLVQDGFDALCVSHLSRMA